MKLKKLKLPRNIRFPKFKLRFTRKLAIRSVIILAVLLFGFNAMFWWRFVYNKPERVFWDALENAFQTTSVTRITDRNTDTQQPDQFLNVQTTPKPVVVGVSKYYESGDRAIPTLVTETLGLREADYVRITDMRSLQGNKPAPDISDIKNSWAKVGQEGVDTEGQQYNQLVLGLIPFGNLNPEQRAELMRMIYDLKAYELNPNAPVERSIRNGRPTYSYLVTVAPEPYIKVLKQFALDINNHQLEAIETSTYRDFPALQLSVVVDVWSRQIISTQSSTTDEINRYTAHGLVAPSPTAPTTIVPLSELQKRLQSSRQE